MAHLDEVIAFNQKVAGTFGPPSGLSQHARRELCIITCVDPRLVRFFPSALGVERGDAVLIRLPGAVVRPGTGDGLRAVAAAVYINRATEFLVMGHTQCGTTTLDVAAVTSEMDKRKVPAGAMPGGVREFLGAVADMRLAVKHSAQAIRDAPFIPGDVLVHAAILNIETGELEIVERGENFQSDGPTMSSALASGNSLSTIGGSVQNILDAAQQGMSFLSPAPTGSLFDGTGALAASADPFAGLASLLPPGWSDGAAAMAPSSVSAAPSQQAAPSPSFPEAPANRAVLTTLESATPTLHAQPAPRRDPQPPPPERQPLVRPAQAARPALHRAPRPAAPANTELDDNMSKVRDFYKVNFTLDQRRKVARTLAQAARAHQSSGELVKIVVKPILDLGQKRYKVIDEVIAIKEQAARMDPDDALVLLSQIFQ